MALKKLTRAQRWSNASNELQEAYNVLSELVEEYRDWREVLPENLDGSAVAEKLDTLLDTFEQIDQGAVEEITEVDLPLGFGRD